MRGSRNDRRPRGKYARLICQRCRSRKIKCMLPNPAQVELSGKPQAPDQACDRCRNFGLECIVERTMLGRPAADRGRGAASAPALAPAGADADAGADGGDADPLDIKEYMWSGHAEEPLQTRQHPSGPAAKSRHPSKQDVFESIIDPACFLSLVLANNPVFGSSIVHAATPWKGSLPDLIDDDLLLSLEKFLAWHRFFLPQTPSLMSVRHRLLSDNSASHTSATELLFALLCLMALETPESPPERYSQLFPSVQLAVLSYGQEFIFSPPIHRDSVVVSLLLSDYRPTAIVSSQNVAHTAVKSDLYVNIAYRIAERLEMLPEKPKLDFHRLRSLDSSALEAELIESLQTLQLYFYDALTKGYIATPVVDMLQLLGRMQPYIEVYEQVLKSRSCSPRAMYHIYYVISNYTLTETMAKMKQNWTNLDNLAAVMETGKARCIEHIESCSRSLPTSLSEPSQDELSAASALLRFRFEWISMMITGAGLLYAMALQARARCSPTKSGPEISYQEGVQIGTIAVDNSISLQKEQRAAAHSSFMGRFAVDFPSEMTSVLRAFLDCGDRLAINEVGFHPPPRRIVLEVVILCKNLVENVVVFLKSHNALPSSLPERLEMLTRCERQLNAMIAAPWTSTNAAFASGCIYAASSKLVHRLIDFTNTLEKRLAKSPQEQPRQQHEDPPPFFDLHPVSLDGPDLGLDAMPSSEDTWNSWPHFGGFDMFETSDESFDWALAWDMFDQMGMGSGAGLPSS